MSRKPGSKPLRTQDEQMVGKALEKIFNASDDPVETRLENFPKYVRRQNLTLGAAASLSALAALGVKIHRDGQ